MKTPLFRINFEESCTDLMYVLGIIKSRVQEVRSHEELLDFWRNPTRKNLPEYYSQGEARSAFLTKIIRQYASPDFRILEIGCNVGRNLEYLRKVKYKKLSGIEMNRKAILALKKTFPQLAKHLRVYEGTVEDNIKKFSTNKFDLVFTMAVLEHIHPESEWIFPEIARIAGRTIVTVENERHFHWRSVPRRYKNIFEQLGFVQRKVRRCTDIDELGPTYFARVFEKNNA